MRKFLSVLLALMMVVSTVSFAAPAVVTVADSATDANVVYETTEVTTENETAELSAESDYGTLVYSVDFERSDFNVAKFSEAYAMLASNPIAAYLNPDFNFSNVTTYTNAAGDGFSNAALVTENGNTYIKGDVNAGYDGYFRMTKYTNPWPKGQYTFSVDIKVPAGQANKLAAQCNDTAIDITSILPFSTTSSDWQTVVYQTTNVVSGDDDVDSGLYGFFVTPRNAAAGTVAYDNWAVYYKPADTAEATVVIDPNGKQGSSSFEITGLTANDSVSVSELLAKAKEQDSTIVGFSLTAGGDKLSADATVPVEYYKRLYAVYGVDESTLGTKLFEIDFEQYNENDVVPDNKTVEECDADALTNGEFTINWEAGGNKIAVDNDGNKYIRGGQGWSQFRIQNNQTEMPKGTYTVVAKAKDFGTASRILKPISQGVPDADGKTINVDATVLDPWAGKVGSWDDIAAEWDENAYHKDMTYFFTDGATTDVGFDNVKLYYQPADDAEFTVTVKAIGNSSAASKNVTVAAKQSVSVADLKATMPGCMYLVESENSFVPLDENSTITPLYNKTVYAVYGFTVTVKPNGNKDFTEDVVLENIDPRYNFTIGRIITEFNKESLTSRKLLGFSTSATGALIDENTVIKTSQTLYAIWEADESLYGTKLFEIDFEQYDAGYVVPDDKTVEEYDADALTNGEFTINWEVGNANGNKIADDSGNKYIRGGQGYSQFRIINNLYNDAAAPMPDGTYTVVASVIDFGSEKRIISATVQKTNINGTGVTATTSRALIDSFSGENNKWDLVAGQWYGSSNDMTIYFTDKAATEVGFDNVKLYFEPATNAEFTVTVDKNGHNGGASNKYAKVKNGESITAGELAALMTGCAGVSLTENGEALPADYVITPKYNMTVYALWEYEESEYGTLLFQIDFEKDGISLPEGESRIPVKDIATVYNKDLVFGNNIMFSAGKQTASNPLDNREIVEENGNKYFRADFSDLEDFEYYTYFSIIEQESKVDWMNGTYTFVADFKTDKTYTGFAYHVNNESDNVNLLDDKTSNENVWDTVAYQYTGEISSIDYGNGPTGNLYFAPRISSKDSYVGGKISVDNIKLFFKTDETVFTVKNGGNPKVDTLEIPVSTTDGITVQEMLDIIDTENSDYELLGIADTPTGAVLDPETKFVPKYQRTFYMIWERGNENPMRDKQLGKLLFAVDFEKEGLAWNGDSALDGDLKWGKGALVSDVATLYDTELFDGEDFRIRFLTNDRNEETFKAEISSDENGDHFLTGTNGKDGTNDNGYTINGTKHPQMFIVNNAQIAAGNGIYTVFVEVSGPDGDFDVHTSMTTNTDKDYKTREIDFFTYENSTWEYKPDEWNQFAYRYEISDGGIIPMSGAYFSLTEFDQLVSFDNYNLYFKPYTATITLLPGEYEEFGVHTVENISTTGGNTAQDILDQLSDHFKAAGKTAVGLVDEDGFELDLEAELIIPCEMTYTIIWGDDTHDYVVTQEKNAIRYSSNDKRRGIRFLAETKPGYAYGDTVTEYGWIVTRESMLVNAGISPTCFTKESSKVEGVKVASGQNYGYEIVEEGDDGRKHFFTNDETIMITMVVYGLTKPEQLTENLVARPYMVVGGETYYGQPWARSMFDAALAVKNNDYIGCDDETKAYVDEIINTVLENSNDIEFDYGEL
ncbi:MAG: hypothetical protein J6E38_04835 [Clostridia bacterium]|nr:hypothetical protein [Clostridia bacterium]